MGCTVYILPSEEHIFPVFFPYSSYQPSPVGSLTASCHDASSPCPVQYAASSCPLPHVVDPGSSPSSRLVPSLNSPSIDAKTSLCLCLHQCPYFASFRHFSCATNPLSTYTPTCCRTHTFIFLSTQLTQSIWRHTHISKVSNSHNHTLGAKVAGKLYPVGGSLEGLGLRRKLLRDVHP